MLFDVGPHDIDTATAGASFDDDSDDDQDHAGHDSSRVVVVLVHRHHNVFARLASGTFTLDVPADSGSLPERDLRVNSVCFLGVFVEFGQVFQLVPDIGLIFDVPQVGGVPGRLVPRVVLLSAELVD